jgi:hypothetical protein
MGALRALILHQVELEATGVGGTRRRKVAKRERRRA